jgi:hypothetical protein
MVISAEQRLPIALLNRGTVIPTGAKLSLSVSRKFLSGLREAFYNDALINKLYDGKINSWDGLGSKRYQPAATLRENPAAIISSHLREKGVPVSEDEIAFINDFVIPLFESTIKGNIMASEPDWSDSLKLSLVSSQGSSVINLAARYLETKLP